MDIKTIEKNELEDLSQETLTLTRKMEGNSKIQR